MIKPGSARSPVLADIDPRDGPLGPGQGRRTRGLRREDDKAILPVHIYGQLADMRALRKLAEPRGIYLVEDAAQAHGASRDGARAGEIGDAACFSFYPTKNLGGAGDSGMVISRHQEIADRVRRLRDHGSGAKYHHIELGTASRLDAIQAAILSVKLPHLERWNQRRRELAQRYDEAFSGTGVAQIGLAPESLSAHHQYAVRIPGDARERVQEGLRARGIASAVHYPIPVHLQPAASEWGYGEGSLPEAERLARQVLCLPVHPFLADGEVDRVAEALIALVD